MGYRDVTQLAGEPFMQTKAGESLASAAAKLRDHACAALIYQEDKEWRVMPAEALSWLLLMRPEILEQPVSALAQPLKTISDQDSPATLHWALQAHAWVGVVAEGKLHRLHQWASLLADPCHFAVPRSRYTDHQDFAPIKEFHGLRPQHHPSPPLQSLQPEKQPGWLRFLAQESAGGLSTGESGQS